jgi:hypothetical protein
MVRIILIIFSVLVLSMSLIAQNLEAIWNFDGEQAGNIPPGFTNEGGEWKIVADPTAPSKPNALAQLAENSGSTFNLTLVKGTNYKDLDVSVRMKAIAGKENQGGGLVWRVKNAKNYYVVRHNPLENNYRLYKVEQGKRSQLQSREIKSNGGWHTLRVTMEGDHIQCYFDGKLFLEAKDPTFPEPGKIGLWTKADAQSHFDDLKVIGK